MLNQLKYRLAHYLIKSNHSTLFFSFFEKQTIFSSFLLIELARKLVPYGDLSTLQSQKVSLDFFFTKDKNFDNQLRDKLSGANTLEKAEIDYWVKLLKKNQVEQLQYFHEKHRENARKDFVDVRSTLVTSRGLMTNLAIGRRNLVYLDSVVGVIEAIYIPRRRLVISNIPERKIQTDEEILKMIWGDMEVFKRQWSTPKPKMNSHVIHRPRPLHHVEQEIKSAIKTNGVLQPNRKVFVLSGATCFETRFYENLGAKVIDLFELRKVANYSTLYSSWWPLETSDSRDHSFWECVKNSIVESAPTGGGGEGTYVPTDKYGVFLSITSGEKRAFVNEADVLSQVVNWAQGKWGTSKVFFVFDGWTLFGEKRKDNQNVMQTQNKILTDILQQTGLGAKNYISLIGTKAEPKVRYALGCQVFFSGGSPVVWPSKIAGIPGVIHGAPEVLRGWMKKSVGGHHLTVCVDADSAKNEPSTNDTGKNNDSNNTIYHQNYSVSADKVIELLETILR